MLKKVLLVLIAGSSYAAPAFVQGKVCQMTSSGSSLTCAFPASVKANSLLVAVGRADSAPNLTISTSSGSACTWSVAVPFFTNSGNANFSEQVSYCVVSSAGAETVKLALSKSEGYADLSILEYSGISTSGALDVASSAVESSSTPSKTCNSGATSALAGAGELAIGSCGMWNQAQTWASTSGSWTNRPSASTNVMGIYDSIQSGTSPVTWSYTLGSADNWGAFVVTFKPAASAPAKRVIPHPVSF